jgi:hypothetical protein
MRTIISSTCLLAVISSLSAGCSDNGTGADKLVGEADVSQDNDDSAKADAAGNSGYYSLEVVRLFSPIDGAVTQYRLRRANSAKTKCANGVKEEHCRVTKLDTKAVTFFGEEERNLQLFLINQVNQESVALMVRGSLKQDSFVATEVWRQEADINGAPNHGLDGVAVKVKDNGIRCITTPCPTLLESKLNSTKSQIIDNVFAPSDELTSSISNSIFSGKPVIVIGDLREITTQTTTAERTSTVRSREAVAVFTRIGK